MKMVYCQECGEEMLKASDGYLCQTMGCYRQGSLVKIPKCFGSTYEESMNNPRCENCPFCSGCEEAGKLKEGK